LRKVGITGISVVAGGTVGKTSPAKVTANYDGGSRIALGGCGLEQAEGWQQKDDQFLHWGFWNNKYGLA
jgi:hypothetical protein